MRLLRGCVPLAVSVCAAASGSGSARVVRAISITVVPSDHKLSLKPGFAAGDTVDPDRPEQGRTLVERQLQEQGYLWATVELDTSSDSTGLAVRYRVNKGRPARVGGWVLAGDDSLLHEPLVRALPGPGARYSTPVMNQAVSAVLALHEERGFPLASVRPVAIAESADRVYPTLEIMSGPRVNVGFLEFAGRPGTKPGLLLKLARFRSGGYSPARLGAWRRHMERSGLVRVDSQALVSKDGTYGMRFWLTGQRSNQASATVGYLPQDRRFTGFVRLGLANLFDTGRRLDATWQSAFGRTTYSLSYTEPWVAGTGFDVTASAQQQTVDTTYAQTNLALSAMTVAGAAGVSFETGYDRFTDVALRAAVQVVWAGTGFEYDTRDFAANPRRGMLLDAGTKAGTRASDSASAQVVSRNELGLSVIVPAGARLAWSNTVAARFAYSPAVLTEPELYRMGGPRTVRGFREDEFASSRLGWVSSELRLVPDRQSRLYPFVDLGTYADSTGWHLEPAYGVGARAATRAGVLGVDYGVAFGENPLRGMVHLSFDATF